MAPPPDLKAEAAVEDGSRERMLQDSIGAGAVIVPPHFRRNATLACVPRPEQNPKRMLRLRRKVSLVERP
jgi:hypothetical protein